MLLLTLTFGKAFAADINDIKAAAVGNTDFAFALYGRLKGDSIAPKGNIFFSPYSISTALALVYSGARGETEKQMATALHFTLPADKLHPAFGALQKQLIECRKASPSGEDKSRGYRLLVANALWGQKGEPFLKEFLDITQNCYGAGLRQLDFVNETEQSRQTINSWVEEKTMDKIKNLIPPGGVNPGTELVLTNAIYFKGDWQTKFKNENTKQADFAVSSNHKVKAPMMYLKENFKYYKDRNLQALQLPYKGDQISMLVLLPREIEGLAEVESTLSADSLNSFLSKMHTTEVEVYLPKFKMTWGAFSLNKALIELGMPDAFKPEADFSGINGKRNLWISDVFHKAFIEVNEEGTEAAAATGVVMITSIRDESPVFRADHPFIFIIRDNRSGSILFMGRLMNPVE
jgi:serpin B